ncbi:MAG TPA: hypothetical protein VM143_11080 [Acidimicrobiales bacterium]|nr:hypothetical protein [Acidimicrobiales bacterium]
MSHMVIYRSVEGQPVFHQVENLEDAARHVETLRNAGQGGDARIFAMKEVKIEVKTYYRVEVAPDEAPAAAPKPAVAADPAADAAAPPPPPPAPAGPAPTAPPVAANNAPAAAAAAPAAVKPEPAAAGAAANGGRFGLFGKG